MLRKHQLSLIDCEREINVYNYVTEPLERKSEFQSVGIRVGSHVTFNVLLQDSKSWAGKTEGAVEQQQQQQ